MKETKHSVESNVVKFAFGNSSKNYRIRLQSQNHWLLRESLLLINI